MLQNLIYLDHIDQTLSEKYHITYYGLVGMEIIRGHKSAVVFNKHKVGPLTEQEAMLANWLDAVQWAMEHPEETEAQPAETAG